MSGPWCLSFSSGPYLLLAQLWPKMHHKPLHPVMHFGPITARGASRSFAAFCIFWTVYGLSNFEAICGPWCISAHLRSVAASGISGPWCLLVHYWPGLRLGHVRPIDPFGSLMARVACRPFSAHCVFWPINGSCCAWAILAPSSLLVH